MTTEEAIEHAAGALNFGWQIQITVENGYGGLELVNTDDEIIWSPDVINDGTLAEQIVRCCEISHGL